MTKTKTKTRPVARIADMFARHCERCRWVTETLRAVPMGDGDVCKVCGGPTAAVLGAPK